MKRYASSFRALIGVVAAICAASIPLMTKPSVANNKLVEAQHLDACSPQWLPVLLASSFQPPPAPHNGRLTRHNKVFVLEVDGEVEAPFVCEAKLPPMFNVEREIVASLRASPYVTRNASEATWVLVAIQPILYQYCAKNSTSKWEDAFRASARAVNDHIIPWLRTLPHWARRGGMDHLFLFSAGAGSGIYNQIDALKETGVILATSYDGPTPERPRTVVVPASIHPLLAAGAVVDGSARAFAAKTTAGFFRGLLSGGTNSRYSFGTRQLLHAESTRITNSSSEEALPLQIAQGNVPNAVYARELGSARFCLALPGHYAFTPRNVQFLNAGCVPINVSPYGTDDGVPRYPRAVHLPFQRTIDWDGFSLTVDQQVVKTPSALRRTLLKVPPERWAELVARMNTERLKLIWEVHGGTAWGTLVEELRRLTNSLA